MDLESSVLTLKNYLIIAKAMVIAPGLVRPLVGHMSSMESHNTFNLFLQIHY